MFVFVDLIFVFPQKSYAETLMPNVIILKMGESLGGN